MFSIDVSWHEQDEVRDPVLRQTWGMLRITVDDEIVTTYANKLSRAIQEGPSVSVFPMARYLVLLPAKPVIDELARFMDQVYLRLKDLPPPVRASDEVNEVLERWQFIRGCGDEQRRLGRRLAMFGIEPFEESVTEELEQEILGLSLDESLVTDLLSAVAEDVGAVSNAALRARLLEQALSKVPPAGPEFRALRESAEESRGELESALPYQTGYARARWLRRRLGLSPVATLPDVPGLFRDGVHLSPPLAVGEHDNTIRGATDTLGRAVLGIGSSTRREDRRFLEGRALHHLLFASTTDEPKRLLTKARDWAQAASRAFAAELLAPMEAIEFDDSEEGTASFADQAAHFGVSERVIFHQLKNRAFVQ